MVNVREQCAWVHAADPEGATRKAKELVRVGVARIRLAQPLHKEARAPRRSALVIGGGVSGMTAALTIADSGFDVHLVEKSDALGGNLHHIHYVAEGANPQRLLRDLVNRVVAHERITLHLRSEVIRHSGSVGAFRAILRSPAGEIVIEHGATIVATGGRESHGGHAARGLGRDARLLRQSELEEIIAHQPERVAALKHVVMIQCVRPEGAPDYCSRTCCTNTLKNAIRIKMLNPGCRVTILYKDIITYGFREKFYLEARRRGVLFVRYTDSDRPVVEVRSQKSEVRSQEAEGAQSPISNLQLPTSNLQPPITVRVHEHIFGETLEFRPDLVALSMSIAPGEDTAPLARTLGVPLSVEGFFLEAHLKMRPMDFMEDGIFLAGMAHYPKFIEECIANALAAAGRAITVLSKETMYYGGSVAVVDAAKCTGCLTCVRTCPFGIPQVRADLTGVGGLRGTAWIDPARCQGCGTCTAECPAKAIQLLGYRDEQIMSGVGAWKIGEPMEIPA
jgi:heterodisulfide reductase subunit A-like polyferredoxin